mmetsp:Transcript_2953/g.4476  ORF Transcript_2953/g.4476 Transcript_2953/m.4476 type:complete len:207 (+) Transcript_2953:111-731(+)
MAEAHEADEVFVYMGGEQEVPRYLRRARIHRSVIVIPRYAFYGRDNLIDAEFHDGIERIEKEAFYGCTSLRGSIKLLGVRVVEIGAFDDCTQLTEIEFGDKLETIDRRAFDCCRSLTNAIIPSVRYIGIWAFSYCEQLRFRFTRNIGDNRRQCVRKMPPSDTNHHAIERQHDWIQCMYRLPKFENSGPSWGDPQNCCLIASGGMEK